MRVCSSAMAQYVSVFEISDSSISIMFEYMTEIMWVFYTEYTLVMVIQCTHYSRFGLNICDGLFATTIISIAMLRGINGYLVFIRVCLYNCVADLNMPHLLIT